MSNKVIVTLPFAERGNIELKADVHYLPVHLTQPRPVLIHWHGGGLSSGSRAQHIPRWLVDPLLTKGVVFISPDYRLLGPANGFNFIEDATAAVLSLLNGKLNNNLFKYGISIDRNRVLLGGQSAGALLALLAVHALPSHNFPCLILEAGCGLTSFRPDVLLAHSEKKAYFTQDKALDVEDTLFKGFRAEEVHNNPFVVESTSKRDTHGNAQNPRMKAMQLWLQQGTFLDVYTGRQGLSAHLRNKKPWPQEFTCLFPALCHTPKNWPHTVLIHGAKDTVVLPSDSQQTAEHLKESGIEVNYISVPGGTHGGDVREDQVSLWQPYTKAALEAILRHV